MGIQIVVCSKTSYQSEVKTVKRLLNFRLVITTSLLWPLLPRLTRFRMRGISTRIVIPMQQLPGRTFILIKAWLVLNYILPTSICTKIVTCLILPVREGINSWLHWVGLLIVD